MRKLFSPLEPYATRVLRVEAPHRIYVEECGNPEGLPVVFVHGGPGGGCTTDNRRYFDPQRYRIVLFDQRGCGRSTPHAELKHNTTQALVADMEQIRETLGIERWVVFGGSWGSTLSLVYAETYPERVLALVVRGIFLVTPDELRWFYQDGIQHLFPDYFEEFVAPIPESERGDLMHAYYLRLISTNPQVRRAAAEPWSLFEARCSSLLPSQAIVEHFSDPDMAMAIARIECHYFVNNCFLAPDQIIRAAARLHDIPGVIVQGRYDVVCPAVSAWRLHKAWPQAKFVLVPDAGHASSEPGICAALVEATDLYARRLAVP